MADEPSRADNDGPASADRPFWSLSRDDQRVLWITFVGGFASIVAGAVIIGAAIALARFFHGIQQGSLLLGILTFVCVFMLVGVITVWRDGSLSFARYEPLWARLCLYGGVGGTAVFVLLVALIWVGLAAGVK